MTDEHDAAARAWIEAHVEFPCKTYHDIYLVFQAGYRAAEAEAQERIVELEGTCGRCVDSLMRIISTHECDEHRAAIKKLSPSEYVEKAEAEGCRSCRITALRNELNESFVEIDRLKEKLSDLADSMIYQGNSVSYIYQKKEVYGKQLSESAKRITALESELAASRAECEWLKEALPSPTKLHLLADWLDLKDRCSGNTNNGVQTDLRKWADVAKALGIDEKETEK